MFQGRGDTHGFQMTLQIFEVFFSFLFNLFVISFQFCDNETQTHLQLFISVPFFWWGEGGEKGGEEK